jgi:hypothetical protein
MRRVNHYFGKYFAKNWVERCSEDQHRSGDGNIECGGLLPIRSANARKTRTGRKTAKKTTSPGHFRDRRESRVDKS